MGAGGSAAGAAASSWPPARAYQVTSTASSASSPGKSLPQREEDDHQRDQRGEHQAHACAGKPEALGKLRAHARSPPAALAGQLCGRTALAALRDLAKEARAPRLPVQDVVQQRLHQASHLGQGLVVQPKLDRVLNSLAPLEESQGLERVQGQGQDGYARRVAPVAEASSLAGREAMAARLSVDSHSTQRWSSGMNPLWPSSLSWKWGSRAGAAGPSSDRRAPAAAGRWGSWTGPPALRRPPAPPCRWPAKACPGPP